MAKPSHNQAIALAQRAQKTNARHRARMRSFEHELIRKGTLLSAAGGLGMMKQHGVSDSVGGVPFKPIVIAAALLVQGLAKSPVVTAFFAGVSDAASAIYVHNAVATKNWVAGDEL